MGGVVTMWEGCPYLIWGWLFRGRNFLGGCIFPWGVVIFGGGG
jgi:hypothetical protein